MSAPEAPFCRVCYPTAVAMKLSLESLAYPLLSTDDCPRCTQAPTRMASEDREFWEEEDVALRGQGVGTPLLDYASVRRPREGPRLLYGDFVHHHFGDLERSTTTLPHLHALLRHKEVSWPPSRWNKLLLSRPESGTTFGLLENAVIWAFLLPRFPQTKHLWTKEWKQLIAPALLGSRPTPPKGIRGVAQFDLPGQLSVWKLPDLSAGTRFQLLSFGYDLRRAVRKETIAAESIEEQEVWMDAWDKLLCLPETELRAFLQERHRDILAWTPLFGQAELPAYENVVLHASIFLGWCEGRSLSHRPLFPSVIDSLRQWTPETLIWHPSGIPAFFEHLTQALYQELMEERHTQRLMYALDSLVRDGPTTHAFVELGPDEALAEHNPIISGFVRSVSRRAGLFLLPRRFETWLCNKVRKWLAFHGADVHGVYDLYEVRSAVDEGRLLGNPMHPVRAIYWGSDQSWMEDAEDPDWSPEMEADSESEPEISSRESSLEICN